MNLLELTQKRHSVRSFSGQPVESEKLAYILECARHAPSAVNYQPWKFYVITKPEAKEKLQQIYPRKWFETAPMYLLACGDSSQSWKRSFDGKDHLDIDVAIAVEHICLAAAEQGLGSCWVCHFDTDLCQKEFGLPHEMVPVAIIPLGYPAKETTRQTDRKALSEIMEVW
ncbi:nitroreductase family protein [Gaoshiqia sediminis]|uniref:Nitroreductase family protein n=1 Tax=Gaoshiqia sediminis TaxID=2986998 RepID=A0AA42C774_9BACT|nr:nitroreductase family protein [Gaoshiqia sediminis]MCW0481291.1 nitroreductase family protein [Gaoshiqia sediminis]